MRSISKQHLKDKTNVLTTANGPVKLYFYSVMYNIIICDKCRAKIQSINRQ